MTPRAWPDNSVASPRPRTASPNGVRGPEFIEKARAQIAEGEDGTAKAQPVEGVPKPDAPKAKKNQAAKPEGVPEGSVRIKDLGGRVGEVYGQVEAYRKTQLEFERKNPQGKEWRRSDTGEKETATVIIRETSSTHCAEYRASYCCQREARWQPGAGCHSGGRGHPGSHEAGIRAGR